MGLWEHSNTVTNFGENVQFEPEGIESPANEQEVLELLQGHHGKKFRAFGSLHSWSRVTECKDVAINLGEIQWVAIREGEQPTVEVGAGYQVKQLIAELNRHGYTLPSVGLIMEQTIAGATATATHGSGRHSLTHYIQSLRLATYDENGNPVIREIGEPERLNAVACGIGGFGIITSITLPIRKQYFVEECIRSVDSIAQMLQGEEQYPLQQSFFLPWSWEIFGATTAGSGCAAQ